VLTIEFGSLEENYKKTIKTGGYRIYEFPQYGA
jgi:hypothetical protein